MVKQAQLKIRPLGGLGAIGSNCTLYEYGSTRVLVDCGILFTRGPHFFIDYYIPNWEELKANPPQALVITHGHEDHIGAIKFFIEDLPEIPIYCTPFAGSLINRKISSFKKKLNYFKPGEQLQFDSLSIFPIHVNHSIPETTALIFQDKNKDFSVLHITDFKIDHDPLYEKKTDFATIKKKFKESKTSLSLVDSTNIYVPHATPNEKSLIPRYLELFEKHSEQRLFITLFASNVHRVKWIQELCLKMKRPIAVLGNSVNKYIEFSIEHQIIRDEGFTDNFNSKNTVILVAGCQGDFFSALRRLSDNEVKEVKLNSDDVLIFSSKNIPGNESQVNEILNKLSEHKLTLYPPYGNSLHVSGHPGRESLSEFYREVIPDYTIPVHGETHFLFEHQEFIKKDFPKTKCLIAMNFNDIIVGNNKVVVKPGFIPSEPKFSIHQGSIKLIPEDIRERKKLVTRGLFMGVFNKNPQNFLWKSYGVPIDENEIQGCIDRLINSKRSGNDMHQHLKKELTKYFKGQLKYSPLVEIITN